MKNHLLTLEGEREGVRKGEREGERDGEGEGEREICIDEKTRGQIVWY